MTQGPNWGSRIIPITSSRPPLIISWTRNPASFTGEDRADPLKGKLQIRLIAQVHRHEPAFGLVADLRRTHLQHHRIADVFRGLSHLVPILRQDPLRRRNPVIRQQPGAFKFRKGLGVLSAVRV